MSNRAKPPEQQAEARPGGNPTPPDASQPHDASSPSPPPGNNRASPKPPPRGRPLYRRISLLLVLAVAAGLMGLLAAPQMMLTVMRLAPGSAPVWAVQLVALSAFEAGLWGAGLSVWFVARRLRWLTSLRTGLAVIAAPVAWETLFNLFVGESSPGWSSALGLAIRLLVGGLATALALLHARSARRAAG